jgi:hypothetical protein
VLQVLPNLSSESPWGGDPLPWRIRARLPCIVIRGATGPGIKSHRAARSRTFDPQTKSQVTNRRRQTWTRERRHQPQDPRTRETRKQGEYRPPSSAPALPPRMSRRDVQVPALRKACDGGAGEASISDPFGGAMRDTEEFEASAAHQCSSSLVLGLLRVGHRAPLRAERLASLRSQHRKSISRKWLAGCGREGAGGRALGGRAPTSPKVRSGCSSLRVGRRSWANAM